MDISQTKKLRVAGKLEEMAAVAHDLGLYATGGLSVHYRALNVPLVSNVESLIFSSVAQVIRELPTLFAVPITAAGTETYFARLPFIDLRRVVSFVQRQAAIHLDVTGRDAELDALLQQQVNTNFKSDQGILPVWRLVILHDFAEPQHFMANFMISHTIADGASLQMVQRAFQKALHGRSSSHANSNSHVEYIISSKDGDAIGAPLELIHSLPIAEETPPTETPKYNDWRGNPTKVPSDTGYVTLTLEPSMVQAFTQVCKRNKVATPAGLNALIAKMVYSNLPSAIESFDIVIPVDVRADLPPNAVDGVMGNFYDTFRTRIVRSDLCGQNSSELGDIWIAARKVQIDTRQYFARTAPSGETYFTSASLKNIPDVHAFLQSMIGGPRSESLELAYIGPHVPFSDPKLGDKLLWQTGRAMISRSAFALGACLQMTVVLHTEGMTIGFAWPKGAIESTLVEATIGGLQDYFSTL